MIFYGITPVQTPEEHGLEDIITEADEIADSRENWLSEYGFGLSLKEQIDGNMARMMGDYMARSLLIAAGSGKVDYFLWFSNWKCIEGKEYCYDMWRWPNPLPVVPIFSNIVYTLGNTSKPERINIGSAIRCYVFDSPAGSLATLWVPANKKMEVVIPGLRKMSVTDVMGNPVRRKGDSLDISGSPVFLKAKIKKNVLSTSLKKLKLSGQAAYRWDVKLASAKEAVLYIDSMTKKSITGTAKLTVGKISGETEFTSVSGKNIPIKIKFNTPLDLSVASKANAELSIKLEGSDSADKIPVSFDLIPCVKVDTKIKIDGNLTDWKNCQPLAVLCNTSNLYPPDAETHKLWEGANDLSAKAYLGWDSKNVYFAIEIKDETHINDSFAERIWNGDAGQIAFAPAHPAPWMPKGYGPRDKEFSFGYSTRLKKACIFQHVPYSANTPRVVIASKRTAKGMNYEVAVPFDQIKPISPEKDSVFGFNFIVMDKDSKKAKLCWMALTPGIALFKEPVKFKKFYFAK
jgi:hypothetical protein